MDIGRERGSRAKGGNAANIRGGGGGGQGAGTAAGRRSV